MARLPGAISLAPSEGSGESRRAAGGESQPRHRIAPLLPCLPLIPVKQQTRPVWEKIQKGKATTKTLSSLPFSPSPPPAPPSPPPGCVAKKESYGFGYCTWGRGKSSDTAGRPTWNRRKRLSACFWGMEGRKDGRRDTSLHPLGGWCQAEIPAHTQDVTRDRGMLHNRHVPRARPLTSPQAELGSVGSVGVFRPL